MQLSLFKLNFDKNLKTPKNDWKKFLKKKTIIIVNY